MLNLKDKTYSETSKKRRCLEAKRTIPVVTGVVLGVVRCIVSDFL